MATKSLNKATLIGHVGKDAEVRYTNSGVPVATFTVATNETWKDKASGQTQERTDWHNIVAWSRLAEICGEYVKKGTRIYVEGRIQNRSYDDKDGNKRYISEINMNDMILLDGRGGDRSGGAGHPAEHAQPSFGANRSYPTPQVATSAAPVPEMDHVGGSDDDLPF
jgi:single-strand DNA-binding protein